MNDKWYRYRICVQEEIGLSVKDTLFSRSTMRVSRYNVYIDAGRDQSFIYNTMTTSLLMVDNKVRLTLEKNRESIDPSVVPSLKKCGILVDDDTDELKMYRLAHNTAKYNTDTSSFLIFTTYACNLRCPYCYEGSATAQCRSSSMSPEMTSAVVKFICNQVIRDKTQKVGVVLYGGEPLLNVNCCTTVLQEVSQWCKTNNLKFSATLMTNGTLFTEKVYNKIGEYLSYVHITLDGPQRFHDKTRVKKDGSGTYWHILQNVEQLKDKSVYISIRVNITEENRHSIGDVLYDLEQIGFKGRPRFHIYFSQVIPYKHCLTFSPDPEFSEQHKKGTQYISSLMKMARDQGWGAHLSADFGEGQPLLSTGALSCGYIKCGIYSIDPEGDIYICPALAGDTRYRTGKIENGSAEWYPAYYDILTRDPSSEAPCNVCEVLPLCGGGCPIASSVREDGSQCHSREILYDRLKAYLESHYL